MEFLRKNLANFISCIRVVGSLILLLFFNEFSTSFLIIYAVCCLTDALDGIVARKLNTCSVLGVALDSVGDALTGFAPVKVLIVQKAIQPWFVAWLFVSVAIFFTSAVISQVKFKKFSFPHTYFDKLLGLSVSISPFLQKVVDIQILLGVVATIFFIASIESVIIEIKLKEAKPFVPSVFHVNK